jgi:hypothetical protein
MSDALPMAGYSGTPLPAKLGLRAGLRVWLVDVPASVRGELARELSGCRVGRPSRNPIDLVLAFAPEARRLDEVFARAVSRLTPAGAVWACWPKRSSGVSTDLSEERVRSLGLSAGLVDVKVCAVDSTYSGLKFVRRLRDRASTHPARPAPKKRPRRRAAPEGRRSRPRGAPR